MINTNNGIQKFSPTFYVYDDEGNLVDKVAPSNENHGDTSIMLDEVNNIKTPEDGVNDGKISFGSKVENFFKGLVKPVTKMFSSPGNFVKGALGIAACAGLCVLTGGAATPFLVGAGIVGGGIQIAKGAINASSAKTDAEAEAAWQDMGTGTFAVGASVAGGKLARGVAKPIRGM